jgi:lysophospholipase L1-like esterase
MAYPAQIIAQTGWTTQNLLDGILSANPQPTGQYDLVTLLIGVNNQYQRKDTGEYRLQFIQCLNKAIAYSGNRKQRVFVLSIPDYGATPFGASNAIQIGIEIDWFNAINEQVCTQMDINYTDITPSTRMAITNPSLVASDGLHPSKIEYAKWANMLLPKMLPLVQ